MLKRHAMPRDRSPSPSAIRSGRNFSPPPHLAGVGWGENKGLPEISVALRRGAERAKVERALANDPDCVVEMRGYHQDTPLLEAVRTGCHIAVIHLLLEGGAMVESTDRFGEGVITIALSAPDVKAAIEQEVKKRIDTEVRRIFDAWNFDI